MGDGKSLFFLVPAKLIGRTLRGVGWRSAEKITRVAVSADRKDSLLSLRRDYFSQKDPLAMYRLL